MVGEKCQGLKPWCLSRLLSGNRKQVAGSFIHKFNGSPCVSEEEILERRRQHFISALNHRPGSPSDELDNEAALSPVDTSVSTDKPPMAEVFAAIKSLRNGRAAGPRGISPELLKCAIHPVAHALHSIFLMFGGQGKYPSIGRMESS